MTAACGRVGFDATSDGGDGGGGGSSDSAVSMGTCVPTDARQLACFAFEALGRDGSQFANHGGGISGVDIVDGGIGQVGRFVIPSSFMVPDAAHMHPTEVSVEGWVRAQGPISARMVVVDSNGQWAVAINPSGQLVCSGINQLVTTDIIATGGWRHFACTFSATLLEAWIDGVRSAFLTPTGAVPKNGFDGMRIGGNLVDANNMNDNGLEGEIDELRIWNYALGAGEICAYAGC